jgi:hypothetical protein
MIHKEFWEELVANFPQYDTDRMTTMRPTVLLLLRVNSLQR